MIRYKCPSIYFVELKKSSDVMLSDVSKSGYVVISLAFFFDENMALTLLSVLRLL